MKRGFWKLTAEGQQFARRFPSLPAHELRRLAYPNRDSRATPDGPAERAEDSSPIRETIGSSPDDRITDALAEIQESLRRDLLERIFARDPDFFERLVLRLLKAMGYGTEDKALEHTGRPGDEGIDGVISLDKLGLDRVYVQAKRYSVERSVSREEIHGFIGALNLKGANKGVFITTSRFTDGAESAARLAHGLSLRLIDGRELTQLMIDHQVGVRHAPIPIPKADLDFWEEE